MIYAKQRLMASLPPIEDYVKTIDLPVLGRGLRGVVYDLQNGHVLKVFENDPLYFEWVMFCSRNQDNSFVPKLTGLKRLPVSDPNCYSVTIEKLKPINQYQLRNFFESVAKHYGLTLNVRRRFIDWLSPEEWATIGEDTSEDLSTVAKWFSTRGQDLDLNHENVMLRGSQFVFADPVF